MAVVLGPEDEVMVEVASGEEIDAAIRAALDELGLTFDELAEQAREDEFTSERGRNLWFQIAPLGGR